MQESGRIMILGRIFVITGMLIVGGCATSGIGDSCDELGSTAECGSEAVCVNDSGKICAEICSADGQDDVICADDHHCKDLPDSNLKA